MNKNEIWRSVEGYNGRYQVSSLGRIKSIINGRKRFLKPCKTNLGYLTIGLFKDGQTKRYLVHRLVAEAFIPNPQNLSDVNHKDEDKENNSVTNLEWRNHRDNMVYGQRIFKMNKTRKCAFSFPVIATDIGTGQKYEFKSQRDASIQLGLNPVNVSSVIHGRIKQTCGYTFQRLDDLQEKLF